MTIPTRDWTTIVERLDDGLCVPFLGAGVNAAGDGYAGLPLGAAVALRLAEDLVTAQVATFEELAKVEVLNEALNDYPHLLRLSLQDLARVAFHLERAVDNPHLMEVVQEILHDRDSQPSRLLKTLARLPVRLIVTTNYDGLMEKAFDEAGREYRRVVQPIDGWDPNTMVELDKELAEKKAAGIPILYKIHGSFDDEAGTTPQIIITEEDYITFLTVVANERRGIPQQISSEMTSATLLFLGYSLEDWDFRTLFKGTIETLGRYKTRRSFAVQRQAPRFWVRFWEEEPRKVTIHDMDLHEFAAQLEERYAKHTAANDG